VLSVAKDSGAHEGRLRKTRHEKKLTGRSVFEQPAPSAPDRRASAPSGVYPPSGKTTMSTRTINQIIACNTLSAEDLEAARGGNSGPLRDGAIGWLVTKALDYAWENAPEANNAVNEFFTEHYTPSEYDQSQQAAQDQARYEEMHQMMDQMSSQDNGSYDGGSYDTSHDDGSDYGGGSY
jgi:hypothetical protein